jgi:hypothetical protein
MRIGQLFFIGLFAAVVHSQAFAWGHDGHETVGAIADRLIVGTNAAKAVKKILGGQTLQQAAVWADCAKGIDPSHNYAYRPKYHTAVCAIYETPAGKHDMADYVRRNDTNCTREEEKVSCHKEYHYADVAVQQNGYREGLVGTDDHDVVHAIHAAVDVLQGRPAPAPFDIKDKQEGLRMLAHFIGDIHQPLHVGAVYLDKDGHLVDPDAGTYDPGTKTDGGNSITVNQAVLHAKWDAVPTSLKVEHVDSLVELAKGVSPTDGDIARWPEVWATETVGIAQRAYQGIDFAAEDENTKKWPASFTSPKSYSATMSSIKKKQLAKAGARFAQTLEAIWP